MNTVSHLEKGWKQAFLANAGNAGHVYCAAN